MSSVTVRFNAIKPAVDPTQVRYAELQEFPEVMKLCRQLHKENGAFSMDEQKVSDIIEKAINRQHGILGVIGHIGEIEGMMLLQLSQFWYTDDWHLTELFSFVPPKYRKSHNARKLLTWAMRVSDGMGLPLFIGIVSTHRTEAKVRLYQRIIGNLVGCFFMHGNKFRPAQTNGATEH